MAVITLEISPNFSIVRAVVYAWLFGKTAEITMRNVPQSAIDINYDATTGNSAGESHE